MSALKLHIGSRERTEGWKTLDAEPGPDVDFVGDCSDLSRFADGSVETIYASHVLEHVPYQTRLLATLKEWHRVLVPGGAVMISVPDLEILCRLFLYPQLDMDKRFFVMRMMFGGQIDRHDFHCVGLTMEFLDNYLRQAGFTDIARIKNFGLFADTSAMMFGGVPISLNVAARKPRA